MLFTDTNNKRTTNADENPPLPISHVIYDQEDVWGELWLIPIDDENGKTTAFLPPIVWAQVREHTRRFQVQSKSVIPVLIRRTDALEGQKPSSPEDSWGTRGRNFRNKLMSRAWELIDAHFAQPLSASLVAAQLRLSLPHFCRIFKQTSGLTFTEALTERRLVEAKRLLVEEPLLSIKEISYKTGFGSVAQFNRCFQRLENSSPSAYKHSLVKKDRSEAPQD